MADHCELCELPIDDDEPLRGIATSASTFKVVRAHRECMLREVMGGIGHLEDHDFWCGVLHDPDAGLSYRESALRVVEWVRENGVPK